MYFVLGRKHISRSDFSTDIFILSRGSSKSVDVDTCEFIEFSIASFSLSRVFPSFYICLFSYFVSSNISSFANARREFPFGTWLTLQQNQPHYLRNCFCVYPRFLATIHFWKSLYNSHITIERDSRKTPRARNLSDLVL